jgi:hypothetical protein
MALSKPISENISSPSLAIKKQFGGSLLRFESVENFNIGNMPCDVHKRIEV